VSGEPFLTGLRILDLSNYTPGPFGTQILADLGATVLKVERPPYGDLERLSVMEYFHAYNRGKHSIALDLRSDTDRAVFHDLVKEADVVVEGFRPFVADRIGAGFEELSRLRPGLIYVSLPGVPSTSEYWMDRAHDSEFQARIGALSIQADGERPSYSTPYPVSDFAAGMYAAIGILAALQRKTSEAVHIEAACFSAGLAWIYPMLCRLVYPYGEPNRGRLPGVGVFETSDGRYLTMSTIEDRGWVRLCQAVGRADVAADPDLASIRGRGRVFGDVCGVVMN
jgi:crotonobetainyl-CoA:carnitine CoA-transferase CaiB-like acyl-CoA transferase